jgi:YVTN family beta-propeller protein
LYRSDHVRLFLVLGFLLLTSANVAVAQTVLATIQVGANPVAIAVNPVTNKIYVANYGSSSCPGTVTVIDGETNASTDVSVGGCPNAVAVDPVTNQIYVAGSASVIGDPAFGMVVIDGATNVIVATLRDDNGPSDFAVDSVTNKIYVTDYNVAGDVRVIDGATNSLTLAIPPGLT